MSRPYTKESIARLAILNSRQYRNLYQKLDLNKFDFLDLPVATPMTVGGFAYRGDVHSLKAGLCFTSSGTTSFAKQSLFARNEWNEVNGFLAQKMLEQSMLREGDVVANLAAPGHASFLLVHDVLNSFSAPITEICIGYDREYAEIESAIHNFSVNVLAGVFSTFIGLAYHMVSIGAVNSQVRVLLGGGERLYGGQRALLSAAFPSAEIKSFVYGATETGGIGHSAKDLAEDEFIPLTPYAHVEILDKSTFAPIKEPDKEGIIVVTNLVRTEFPIVRYSNGDLGRWKGGQFSGTGAFKITGRKYKSHDLGDNLSLDGGGIYDFVERQCMDISIIRFEVELSGTYRQTCIDIKFSVIESVCHLVEDLERIVLERFCQYFSLLSSEGIPVDVMLVGLEEYTLSSRKRSCFLVDLRV